MIAAQNMAKITAVPTPSMVERVLQRSGSSKYFLSTFRTVKGMAVDIRKLERNPTSRACVAHLEVFQGLGAEGASAISAVETILQPCATGVRLRQASSTSEAAL